MDLYHNDLAKHRTKLATGGGEAVEHAAVTGWECFSWDLAIWSIRSDPKFPTFLILTMKVVVFGPVAPPL